MAGYPFDTFQYAQLIRTQLTRFYADTEQSRESSFFISRIKCLWDSVGHFLGYRAQLVKALPAGLFACAKHVIHVDTDQVIQILA